MSSRPLSFLYSTWRRHYIQDMIIRSCALCASERNDVMLTCEMSWSSSCVLCGSTSVTAHASLTAHWWHRLNDGGSTWQRRVERRACHWRYWTTAKPTCAGISNESGQLAQATIEQKVAGWFVEYSGKLFSEFGWFSPKYSSMCNLNGTRQAEWLTRSQFAEIIPMWTGFFAFSHFSSAISEWINHKSHGFFACRTLTLDCGAIHNLLSRPGWKRKRTT